MDWWKAHHGIATDRKYSVLLRYIQENTESNALRNGSNALRNGFFVTRSDIVAVWVWLIDFSSQNVPRGSLTGVEIEEIAVTLDLPDEVVVLILDAFKWKGMIADNALKTFSKRQNSSDPTDAERQKRFRDKKKDRNADRNGSNGFPSRAEDLDLDLDKDLEKDLEVLPVVQDYVVFTPPTPSRVNGKISHETRWPYLADESFIPFVNASIQFWGSQVVEENLQTTWVFTWRKLDFEQKLAITNSLTKRISDHEDPQYVSLPPKYIENGAWKRPPRKPTGNGRPSTDQKSVYKPLPVYEPPTD